MPGKNEIDDPDIGEGTSVKVIISLFVIILIGGIIWFGIEFADYMSCKDSESISCPEYYCPNQINGNSGTKCYDITSNEGEKVPWRYDNNGNLMCQKPQYVAYDQPGYNPANYTGNSP